MYELLLLECVENSFVLLFKCTPSVVLKYYLKIYIE